MMMWLLLLGLAVTSAAAGPGSCVGRCGESFTRSQQCKCDFGCLQHNECCPDFEAVCTTAQSCQGRCGEQFRRGQLCECDPQCTRHNTCCPDHQLYCDASVSASHPGTLQPLRAAAAPAAGNKKSKKGRKKSNSESEERLPVTDVGGSRSRPSTLQDVAQSTVVAPGGPRGAGVARGPCPQFPGGQCPGPLGPLNPWTAGSSGSTPPAAPTHPLQYGVSDGSAGLLPLVIPGSPNSAVPAHALPSYNGPWQGRGAPVSPSGHGAAGGRVNAPLVLSPEGVTPYGSSQAGPTGSRFQAQQDLAQGSGPSMVNGGSQGPGAGLLIDIALCSDSPINGLTAVGNGTILIFKGGLFWSVDPVSRQASQPQSITDTLGVPSPVDTVFTRWSCDGKANTYIIKGDQLWRLDENLAVEPGYPKPLASEFPGLTGPIIAVLVVPATGSQPETLYFFKSGDIMQRFTSPPGSAQSCDSKPRSLKTRLTRQAGLLSGEINIKVSLKGFPSPVTSALTMPDPQTNDGYFHFVFSGPIFFRVQIVGDLPALAKPDPSDPSAPPAPFAPLPIFSPDAPAADPANAPPQSAGPAPPVNSIKVWLRCP